MTRKPTEYSRTDVWIGAIWLFSLAALVALGVVRLWWT